MELTFLGTGAGLPSKNRNVTAIALSLVQEVNNVWLFDCGEATQHQILHTSIKPRKINKIFITHLHGDHLYGLPGLLSSRSFQGGSTPLVVYGPKGIKEYINTSLTVSGTHLTYPLDVIELTVGKLFEDDKFEVYCKQLEHGISSYGFFIKEKDQIGQLNVTKLKDLGISPGPVYQKIKDNETTQLSDGKQIKRADVIGPPKQGRRVAILGDTRSTNKNISFVKDVDVLIHEATFEEASSELAHRYFHSTTVEAAQLAKNSGVKKLILTHISSRYLDEDLPQLLDEARKIFPNTLLAYDFYNEELKNN